MLDSMNRQFKKDVLLTIKNKSKYPCIFNFNHKHVTVLAIFK